jgi:hypothetical protein
MVLSDLPAGIYTLTINYLDKWKRTDVTINPGATTYCTFKGENGFAFDLPDANESISIPFIEDNGN